MQLGPCVPRHKRYCSCSNVQRKLSSRAPRRAAVLTRPPQTSLRASSDPSVTDALLEICRVLPLTFCLPSPAAPVRAGRSADSILVLPETREDSGDSSRVRTVQSFRLAVAHSCSRTQSPPAATARGPLGASPRDLWLQLLHCVVVLPVQRPLGKWHAAFFPAAMAKRSL